MGHSNFDQVAFTRTPFDPQDLQTMAAVCAAVPGYSETRHYSFFRHLLACTDLQRVLVLGVYFGRDVAFLLEAARRAGRTIAITAVDKFSDDACDDWPEGLRGSSWQDAGFGPAPSLEVAAANIAPFQGDMTVELVRSHDEAFLTSCRAQFDLIYIDTAHDYETVRRQLHQALPLLADGGLMAGDDYSDRGTWGVRRALLEGAPGHLVISDWIWVATREQIEAAAQPATV